MGAPSVGSVIIVPFPYADFTKVKKRPALVVGSAELDNLIICQITSQKQTSKSAIQIDDSHFSSGGLRASSYVRPDKIFTIEASLVHGMAGVIAAEKMITIKVGIRKLFS